MSEQETLLQFLKTTGTVYKIFYTKSDRDCIADEALKKKAVLSICVRDNVDFAFDQNGSCLGTYTTGAKSWKKRKK